MTGYDCVASEVSVRVLAGRSWRVPVGLRDRVRTQRASSPCRNSRLKSYVGPNQNFERRRITRDSRPLKRPAEAG